MLAVRIDASRRLVEDEQVRLRHQHAREREPLALAAGEVARVARRERPQPDPLECPPRPCQVAADAKRHLRLRMLGHQVPPRVLREVRGPAEAVDATFVRLEQPRRELGRRRLAAPVRARERYHLAAAELERHAGDDGIVRVSERDVDEAADRRPRPDGAARRRPRAQVCRPMPRQPFERVVARRVEHDPSRLEVQDAVGVPQRPGGPLLREDDRDLQPLDELEERIRRLRIELRGRLVEQKQPRPKGERGRKANPLQLPSGERRRRAVEEVRRADRLERLPRARRDLARRRPEVLEPERDLRLYAGKDDLLLRILEDRRDGSGELGRPVGPSVETGDRDPAGEAPAVEVRHEARERAEQRRLPRAGRSQADDELAGRELERDAVEGGSAGVGVRERQPVDPR